MKKTLKELRESKKLTQKQLAEVTGVPTRTIQDLEADKVMHLSTTRADILFRLAHYLGVSMEYLSGCTSYDIWHILPHQEEIIYTEYSKEDALARCKILINTYGYKASELDIRFDYEDEGCSWNSLDIVIDEDEEIEE